MYNSVCITGASSGIGAALAKQFATHNVHLCLIARNVERLQAVAKTCREQGAIVTVCVLDVTDKNAMQQFMMVQWKKTPFDLVIANAGISNAGNEMTMAQNEAIFAVNVNGVLNTIHPVIPFMRENKQGHIVIVSSLAGFRGLARSPAYSATKAAVRVYGDALAGQLEKYHITVTTICPGFIKTPLTDRNRFNMPFLMSLSKASEIMYRGILRKKTYIVFPKPMYYLVRFLSAIPTTWARALLRHV